jgi:hypothetical protein
MLSAESLAGVVSSVLGCQSRRSPKNANHSHVDNRKFGALSVPFKVEVLGTKGP